MAVHLPVLWIPPFLGGMTGFVVRTSLFQRFGWFYITLNRTHPPLLTNPFPSGRIPAALPVA